MIPPSARGPLAAALLLAACGGETSVRIGLAGPFGDERGAAMRVAAQLAIAELNAAGGIRGRPVDLVLLDDSANAQGALAVARELSGDPSVVAVVGHLTSGATLAAAPTYGGTQPVTLLSPSASSPLLTQAGPWIFRLCPGDDLHGAALAAWARDRLGADRAAVLYVNDDDGRGVRDEFVAAFEAQGGTVVTSDPYLEDLPSFRPYLERLGRRGGADVVIIAGAGSGSGAARILGMMDSLGLDLPVLGGQELAGIERLGPLSEGVFMTTSYLPDQAGAANEAFARAYRRAAGDQPPDYRGAGAYDAVHLIAAAVTAVGTDRERIRDWLAGVGTEHPAFEGATGRIAFDENGDVMDKPITVGVVQGGVLRRANGS